MILVESCLIGKRHYLLLVYCKRKQILLAFCALLHGRAQSEPSLQRQSPEGKGPITSYSSFGIRHKVGTKLLRQKQYLGPEAQT